MPELREVGVDPADAAEVLVEKSGGLFVYAAMAAERLRAARRGGEAVTPEQIRAFPDGLDDFYEEQIYADLGMKLPSRNLALTRSQHDEKYYAEAAASFRALADRKQGYLGEV